MLNELTSLLQHIHHRRLLRDALLWLPRGALAGLLVAVLVALAARLRPLLDNTQVGAVALSLGLLGLVVAAATLLLRRRTRLQQARFADRHFGLKERAATAVEIAEGRLQTPPDMAHKQLADAVHVLQAQDVAAALPLRAARRDWFVLFLTLVLLAAAVWLPNPQAQILQEQRALQESIAEQEEEIEELVEEIEANPELSEEQQEALAEPLRSALEALQEQELTQEEAVAALSEAEADLRDLQASNSNEALQRELGAASAPLSQTAASQSLGQALQSGNLAQAGQAANDLADDLPQLTPDEQAALAEALEQSAAALEQVDGEISQALAEAAEALQEGDAQAAQDALRDAAGQLQERAQEQAAAEQAAAAAGQLSQGRQEVAQGGAASQNGESQEGSGQAQGQNGEGQGQNGSGQGQGQGSGQGAGQGQGQGSGAGSGSGNGGIGGGPGGTGGETGQAEEVFVPDFEDLSGEPGEDVELPAECIANPAACGGLLDERPTAFGDEQSRVPYNEVFADYRDAAYQALDSEPIPLGMKGYIRDYFSSLEP